MNTDINEELIDALRLTAIDGLPVTGLPKNYELRSLRTFKEAPERPVGIVTVNSLLSLVEYFDSQAHDASAIFASRETSRICAILDWHDVDQAGWGRHRIQYELKFTPEWSAWNGISGRSMSQTAFAEFVEENLPDVIEPDGARLLEAVRNVSGSKNITFQSAKNNTNGDVVITWKEETEANGGQKGEAALPAELKLRIPVYRGAEQATTFEVKAFLRYRVNDGKLSFELKLHRADKAIDLAFDEIVSELTSALNAADIDGATVLLGSIEKFPDQIL